MCGSSVDILTFVTPIMTFGGIVFGAAFARNTALKAVDRQEFNRDYLALKNSFIPTIRILRKDKKTREDIISLASLFESQMSAMLAFSFHLTSKNERNFEEKWNKYEKWNQEYEKLEADLPDLGKINTSKRTEEIRNMVAAILESAKKY